MHWLTYPFWYSDKPSEVEGFPQREWSIEVYLVNDKGEQVPATLFDKVTYHLHPSFGSRAVQCKFSERADALRLRPLFLERVAADNHWRGQRSPSRHSVSQKRDGVNSTCRSSSQRTRRTSSSTT